MTLVIGYGNPGRGDDGLGPEFARRLAERALPDIVILTDFQLKVEHAVQIASAARVVFVDAAMGGTVPYRFAALAPADRGDVSSHDVSPATVLALAQLYFGATGPAFVLAISGADFDRIHEGLSPTAERNLAEAERFFLEWLAAPSDEAMCDALRDG